MLKKFLLVGLCAVSIVNASDGLTVSEKVLLRKETVAQTPWTSGLEKLARSVTKEKLKKAAAFGVLVGAKYYALTAESKKQYAGGVLVDALVNRTYKFNSDNNDKVNILMGIATEDHYLFSEISTLLPAIVHGMCRGFFFTLASTVNQAIIDDVVNKVSTLKKILGA